ncbi:O-methyltransferase [Flagellimonas allohymeniacidonis]|uniref:Methyltransferase domain-containing protein n=1 Tax=Flagellimonas allohymeniacidonis TaxID=2517819 RepID=A0A4Q8QES0_9FLAO|nr:class I SAM-dependent methyltransferase [Allomuricauda hymeniacidonis]TAI48951.1 methyltransferase domain-containing protein [Allomuricauda hymeniacidonis]
MDQSNIQEIPTLYPKLLQKTSEIGFDMPSDIYIGTFLKTLCASKPKGRFLEMGTGMGLSLAWMLDGMDLESKVVSVDNDPTLIAIAKEFFPSEKRLELTCADGGDWLQAYNGAKFDLIFADAWPGKYSNLDETLNLVKTGGYYVVDDLNVQPNWPEGHEQHVQSFLDYMGNRTDFTITKMNWSTGILVAVKTQ